MVWRWNSKLIAYSPSGGGICQVGLIKPLSFLKYLNLALFLLAAISLVGVNAYRSYSIKTIQVGATETATTLASTACDSNNLNAPACIGLSISSSTQSSSGDANDLTMTIPDEGGVAAGYQTVKVISNSAGGYTVSLTADVSNPSPSKNSLVRLSGTTYDQNNAIDSVAVKDLNSSNVCSASSLSDKAWGVAIPGLVRTSVGCQYPFGQTNANYQPSAGQAALSSAKYVGMPASGNGSLTLSNNDFGSDNSLDIYYGVRVDDVVRTASGNYQTGVVYTATTTAPSKAEPISVSPSAYSLDDLSSNRTITIKEADTDNNLRSAYSVWIDLDDDGQLDSNEACTNIQSIDHGITCTIPVPSASSNIERGVYSIYIQTQAAEIAELPYSFAYTKDSICRNADPDSDCRVDIDDNMIPVRYTGDTSKEEWTVVTKAEIEDNLGAWYDYTGKQWANAVTVTSSSLSKYQTAMNSNQPMVIDKDDVLGYWVYIPRYAYQVQRRDAVDRVVDMELFDIQFETSDDADKTPAICTSNTVPLLQQSINNAEDYRECIGRLNGSARNYYPGKGTSEVANEGTSWATHPAFNFGSEQLNGFWVGKFEMTGSKYRPTVKPNQNGNVGETVGEYMTTAKHIGVYDRNNTSGSDIQGFNDWESYYPFFLNAVGNDDFYNYHNVNRATSHMIKNSEWGATVYLMNSRFGAGISSSKPLGTNVEKNGAEASQGEGGANMDADKDETRRSHTGCGPSTPGSTSEYSSIDGVKLPSLSVGVMVENELACGDIDHSYIGSIGMLASTTNNVYGVYDMSGGLAEFVAGTLSDSRNESGSGNDYYTENPVESPYADIYVRTPAGQFGIRPAWYRDSDGNDITNEVYFNFGVCTYETCGGDALHETISQQAVSADVQGWGGSTKSMSKFVNYPDKGAQWFTRSGFTGNGVASPFYVNFFEYANDKSGNYIYGTRPVLILSEN